MSKGIYVGALTEVPIYEETITELEPLTYYTKSIYFSQTDYAYGPSWKVGSGIVHGGLRMYTQNIGVNSSTGGTVFTALHDLKNVKVYCEYCTEKNWDKVTTIIAGETVMNEVSGTDNTALNLIWSGDLAAGEKIDCKYVKDNSTHASGEKVYWEITCDPLTEITQEIVGYETKELARKVKKPYVEVEGLARKVKKGYIGVEGVARQFFSGSGFGSFSGDYTVSQVEHDGATYDLYTLTSSGVLTLTDDTRFWMCGGGGSGNASYASSSLIRTGAGGGGGYTLADELPAGEYAIVIASGGDGGAGGNTTITRASEDVALFAANGGGQGSPTKGGDGGSGGAANFMFSSGDSYSTANAPGKGAGVSTYPFGIESLYAHSAGGGGGRMDYVKPSGGVSGTYGSDGGSNGSDGFTTVADYSRLIGYGGEKGGGNGGSNSTNASDRAGKDATFYGSGGGGGATRLSSSATSNSSAYTGTYGKGYQGVFYLLIPA